ncbi:MAG: flagellin [Bacteroidota bacterium]
MRITEGTFASGFLSTVNRSRERIVKLQTQLASGKLIQKPSDDPQAADTILRLKESKNLRIQFQSNALEGEGMTDSTSSTLGQFGDLLMNLKEIVVKATGSGNNEDLTTYGGMVDQLLSEAVDVANTKFNGKFVLGGTQTQSQPYTLAADRSAVSKNPAGIDGVIQYQVGESSFIQANIGGEQALNGTDIFDLIVRVRDSMNNGTFTSVSVLDDVDKAVSHVLNSSSQAGSLANHFSAVQSNLEEQESQLDQYLSLTQDTDIAEATMNLKHEETMLDAALTTGGSIIPKSLLDFLR